jgi:hypothetical protein
LQRAAQEAIPGLAAEVSVVPESKNNYHYASPSAMKFFNMQKKTGVVTHQTCKSMAEDIKSKISQCPDAQKVIKDFDLAPMPANADPEKANYFINITLNDAYIQSQIKNIYSREKLSIGQLPAL